ncbi:MAG: PAS domain S-box protein [Bryobacteraceae bacterium]
MGPDCFIANSLKAVLGKAATWRVGRGWRPWHKVNEIRCFQELFLKSPTSQMIVADGVIIACNPACAAMFGAAPGDLEGLPVASLAPERQPGGVSTRSVMEAVLKQAAVEGQARTELQCRRPDGSHFWCEVVVKATSVAGQKADLVALRDLTEQKRTEEALRRDEARFRYFAEIIQYPARTLKALLGFALERAVELTGSRVGFLFFYDAESKTFTLNTHSSQAERECKIPVSGPVKHLDKTGIWGEAVRQRRPILVNEFQAPNPLKRGYPEGHVHLERFMAVPVFRDKEIVAVVGLGNKREEYDGNDVEQLRLLMEMIWNVVDRLKAEEALAESEERLRKIVQTAQEAVILLDPEGRIALWNPAAERIFGYAAWEVMGQDLHEVLAPQRFREAYRRAFAQFQRTGEGASVGHMAEMAALRKSGEEFPVELALSAFRLRGRWHAIGIVRDISARKAVEEALRRKSQELEDFFQSSLDLLCIADTEGHFVRLNPQWGSVLGYTREELEGQRFLDLVHPDDIPATLAAMEQLKRQEPLLNFENRYRCKDGGFRWIEWRAQPRGNLIYAAARDVTERKRMERDLREANRQLEQAIERANQLAAEAAAASAAKSDFLANMSHEIRTPLHGILGMLQLLEASRLDSEQRRFTQAAAASAGSLLALLEDILDLSRIEAGKLSLEPVPFEIRRMLESVVMAMDHSAAQKGLNLILEVDPGLPQALRGDPKRLRQILTNLISNAIKFTPTGQVRVAARLESEFEEEVVIRCSVTDTGIGIPEDKISLLFQKFTQLDSSTTRGQGGAGLGLAISKQLCELMGGEIGVSSMVGEGSEFWFTVRLGKVANTGSFGDRVPVRDELGEESLRPANSQPLWRGEGIRVLVVEDNQVNRQVVLEMMKRLGIAADAAESGAEALRKLQERTYELVLMDVQMPMMDGYEVSRRIRASRSTVQNPNVPIIAITAHAMAGQRERCLAAGMNDYLSKPLWFSALAETIRRWTAGYCRAPENANDCPTKEHGAPRRQALLARFDHDRELARTAVEAFLADTPCQLRALREALERQDRAEAERVAHSIKGAASYVGGEELRAAAAEIERKLRSGDAMEPEEWIQELASRFSDLRAELSRQSWEDRPGDEPGAGAAAPRSALRLPGD